MDAQPTAMATEAFTAAILDLDDALFEIGSLCVAVDAIALQLDRREQGAILSVLSAIGTQLDRAKQLRETAQREAHAVRIPS